jgi:hypothetical protein
LDAWNPFDIEVLKITAIPNTIERFMNAELGNHTAMIWKMNNKKYRPQLPKPHCPPKSPKPKIVDKYCTFCGGMDT